jgi:hypothetical protein
VQVPIDQVLDQLRIPLKEIKITTGSSFRSISFCNSLLLTLAKITKTICLKGRLKLMMEALKEV